MNFTLISKFVCFAIGLRANIAQNHGVELYSRFGLLETKKDITRTNVDEGATKTLNQTYKTSQPYAVGLRYSFSF